MSTEDADLLKTQRRYEVARVGAVALVVLAALVFSAVMLVLVVNVRQAQGGITSCTEPPGGCYQRSVDNQQRVELNARNVFRLCEASGVRCEDPEDGLP